MNGILTAVLDDDYCIIFGMKEDKTLFAIECEEVEKSVEPISAYCHSVLVLLTENEPKTYAELVFSGGLKEYLDSECKTYNDFIVSMSESIRQNNPDTGQLESEMLAREYWRT